MSILSLIVAVLPIILIGWYIYKRDKIKESPLLLSKLFLGGVVSCFPAALIGIVLGNFFPGLENMDFIQLFIYVFVVIAFVEEICKWYILYKVSYNHREFDSLYDMIVYASFVALGFACFENLLYVSDTGIFTGVVRAFTAIPGHVCDGVLMGSYLALAKLYQIKGDLKLSNKYKKLSILIPMIAHGIYDFCLFVNSTLFLILFLIFVIIIFVICIKKIKNFSKNNIKFLYRNNYCSRCGSFVDDNYCTVCGNKVNENKT